MMNVLYFFLRGIWNVMDRAKDSGSSETKHMLAFTFCVAWIIQRIQSDFYTLSNYIS
jgi:hypothetical protein